MKIMKAVDYATQYIPVVQMLTTAYFVDTALDIFKNGDPVRILPTLLLLILIAVYQNVNKVVIDLVNIYFMLIYTNRKANGISKLNAFVPFIQYVKTSFSAIACLFVAAFLLNMEAYTSSLLYMNSMNMQSPSVQIYMGMRQMK